MATKTSVTPKIPGKKAKTSSPNKSSKQQSTKKTTRIPSKPGNALHIVGIGASAGGLEALTTFFKAMPSDSGIGFVVVVHLDPSHTSILPELLQKTTSMVVSHAIEKAEVEANHVYIIPPNKEMHILHGRLQLLDQIRDSGLRLPIDTFLRSLAMDQEDKAIGIILSGTGTDGTLGIKAIKGETGMVMVQEESSAKYDGMPHSAISTGLADYILSPEKMPVKLISFCGHSATVKPLLKPSTNAPLPGSLQKVFAIIRSNAGHDFSLYKLASIQRRIQRRMVVHQVDSLAHYVQLLQESKLEVNLLVNELLIGVTHFFRDTEAFLKLQEVLEEKIIPTHSGSGPVRVWIPGCSTGEEAYSVAILFEESILKLDKDIPIQIFATDIDEDAIHFARSGRFTESIAADIDEKILAKYFSLEDTGHFRVKKHIREKIVFAQQNVIKDPPFTRLDLLSCRNLLIYFKVELQAKLLPIFHYSLKPDGILFLGSSETVGVHSRLFHPIEKKWKLYQRHDQDDSKLRIKIPESVPSLLPEIKQTLISEQAPNAEFDVIKLVESILKQSKAPPCAIINGDGDIIYIHGHTGKYLEAAEGRLTFSILSMIRPALRNALQSALSKAQTHQLEVSVSGLSLETGGQTTGLDLKVKPIKDIVGQQGLMMVTFIETDIKTQSQPKGSKKKLTQENTKSAKILEQELIQTRSSLQSTIEEYETAIEDLKSTNEELQSTNEELQSTNEELETSKEELQSLNEESSTVNSELLSTVSELNIINDDMSNLMDSTEIAMFFLDADLQIRRFTPRAREIFPLTQKDIQRPLQDLACSLVETDLVAASQRVMENLLPYETQAMTRDGNHYMLRIRPYRTNKNKIDGVVITFENISSLRKLEKYAENIIDTVRQPLLVLNAKLQVVTLNPSFERVFKSDSASSQGIHIYQLMGGQWDIPVLRKLLENILPEKTTVEAFKIEHLFKDGGKRTLLINARQLEQGAESEPLILLAVDELNQ